MHVLLVGDYYQHSVSGTNNSGKPFDSLIKSRRCPNSICEFVKQKPGIAFSCENENEGKIAWLNGNNVHSILYDDKVIKLTWRNAKNIYSMQ